MMVKICGITSLRDAEHAVACGASAIGFVFWPGSPRAVDPQRAREIAMSLPPFVTPVGVFVNQPIDAVNDISARVGLGAVQLHGDEDLVYATGVTRPVWKAMSLAAAAGIEDWPPAIRILLDAHDPVQRGGTGKTIDWDRAAILARRRPIVLAGGLTPENIVAAVACVRPFGIDVSSGVERAPGVKDPKRVEALFSALARESGRETADAGRNEG